MDDWLWLSDSLAPFPGVLTASTDNHRFKLMLEASDDWVLQGKHGYSQKSDLVKRVITTVSPRSILLARSGLMKSLSSWLERAG